MGQEKMEGGRRKRSLKNIAHKACFLGRVRGGIYRILYSVLLQPSTVYPRRGGGGGRGCGSLSPGGGGNCAHSWRSSPASAFFFLGMVGGNGGPLLSNEGHARKRERIRRKEEGQ